MRGVAGAVARNEAIEAKQTRSTNWSHSSPPDSPFHSESEGDFCDKKLKEVKDKSDIFLIASGYVHFVHRRLRLTVGLTPDGSVDLDKAVSDTEAIFKSGADLVLIGQAAMNEPTIVQRLAERRYMKRKA